MNKFKQHEENLVKRAKHSFEKLNLMYKCDGNGIANWNDDWVCFPSNKRAILRFSKWVSLPEENRFDVARAFAIEMVNRNLSPTEIQISIQYAFRACSCLNKRIYNIEQEDFLFLSASFKKLNYAIKCGYQFWNWCQKNQLIPESLIPPKVKENRNRSPEEEDLRHSKMLISDEQVAAIGVAYNELYSDDGLEKYGFKKYPKAYLAIAFSTLGLATPSRGDVEIWGLPTQKIKTHVNKETTEETHSLFWKGSKNHPDNRTHLLSALKNNVDRVLTVLEKESLPAKILSYFMTNPLASLHTVMQSYPEFEYKLCDYQNLDYESQTSIFHLGLILGLYDEDPIVPVHGEHDVRIPVHFNRKWKTFKYLSDIKCNECIANDHTVLSLYKKLNTQSLSGQFTTFQSVKNYLFKNTGSTTLSKLTHLIIDANKFLNGSVDTITKGKSVSTKVSHAMFVYTASTLNMYESKNIGIKYTFDTKVIPIPNMYNLQISTGRPHLSKSWLASALSLVGLEEMAFTLHKLRHWVNHHAKESGISISVINLWSGRKDADQAYEYIHTIDEDNAKQINSILVNKSEMEPSSDIKLISIKEIKDMRKLPATIMSEGVCIQDLVTMPCRYLNDFMTSCFGCQEMCYIKGDVSALAYLRLDFEVQMARLSDVKSHSGFAVNKASQEWYKTHFNKTSILTVLIEILEDDAIPEGASVRMSGDLSSLEFRVQSLDTAKIAVRKFALEDSNKSLNKLLANTEANKNTSNPRLADLLSSYGVNNGTK